MMASASDSENKLYLHLYPGSVVRNIAERVNLSPTRTDDNFILRLLCPNLRRIVSKTMTRISSLELSRVGGRIRDIEVVPELSSFILDFANYNGDDVAFLKNFQGLVSLTITNIDLRLGLRPRDEIFEVADAMHHRCLEQTQYACSIVCPFRFIPFVRGRTNRAQRSSFSFLTGMTALRHLTIDGSTRRLNAILPFVLEMSQLETLSVSLLNFKGRKVGPLRHLRAEFHLTLRGAVSKGGFRELCRFPTLRDLTLVHCKPGSFPFPVTRLRALRRLRIQCSTLDDRDFMRLSEIGDSLSALEISLSDTDPDTLSKICDLAVPLAALCVEMEVVQCDRPLRDCTKLEYLLLEAKKELFSGDQLTGLVQCTGLKDLHVIGCHDWSPILASELLGSSLISLTIGWSNLKREDLQTLRRLESLRNLTLSLCLVSDSLSPLKDMSQLRSLTISHCFGLEESVEEALLSSLPEGLEQLKLGFSDGLGFEAYEDLLATLNERFPLLEILPADMNP